ncbi:hypothetical protein [Candidatus Poriferisodalis sp.]|uniref:hypothetical protein n=1 Tax=Candidatus Poriferisodalis sp. TaxID=3101277 RepID=UPI003B01582D
MTETVTTAQRKQRWHRPRPALPPGHEPEATSRWSWRWNWVRPRDAREWLARLALALIVPAWLLLVDPLGNVALLGMIGSVVVACPAYANWQRRRTPAGSGS